MANKKSNKFAKVSPAATEVPAAEVKTEKAAPAAETVEEVKGVKEVMVAEPQAEAKASDNKKTEKKTSVKKTAEKSKDKFVVQFAGLEFDTQEIIERCKADYKSENSRKQVRSLEVYLKPDERKAYYVVNNKAEGRFIEL